MQKIKNNRTVLILILGSMTALSPFSIDMYLPAFQAIASDFGSTVAQVSLSLSSYFVGLSIGQLVYGPLLDRFGRKPPLYVGLSIYVIASLFCLFSGSTESLIAWRFIQAIGGCVASVASMAMVRDLFSVKESAKIYSLLILILGVSPLLAPTAGGYLATIFGWHSVFLALAIIAVLMMLAIRFFLQESHAADSTVSLQIRPIFKNFLEVLKNAQFYTYVFSGALAFSGLFVYLAGSPVIFLNKYQVDAQTYGWIFAAIAAGLIGSSQFNSSLLKKFTNEQLVVTALSAQVCVGTVFVIGTYFSWFGLLGTVLMFFLFMGCFGLISPNSGALALAPFSKNAGSAAALMGFVQMGIGAISSSLIGIFEISEVITVVMLMAGLALAGLLILLVGRRQIKRQVHV